MIRFFYFCSNRNFMKAVDFKEANCTLTKPDALTDLECKSLKTFTDGKQSISCWKPSFRERISILVFGKVWLSVWGGTTQPPIWIDGQKTVFVSQKKNKLSNCCDRIFK